MTEVYSADEIEKVRTIHDRILALDGHVDLPLGVDVDHFDETAVWPGQFDPARARQGGLSGAALVVHAPPARPSAQNDAAGRKRLNAAYDFIRKMSGRLAEQVGLARSPREFRDIAGDGRLALLISFQNAAPLSDPEEIAAWATRVQMFALTFIGNNRWADSARPYPFIGGHLRSNGLSDLGCAAIGILNDAGVIVDVSQLSSAALSDVLKHTRAPVVASHSAVRAIVDADRNLDDDELLAIRDNGGVVQIVGFGSYLHPRTPEKLEALRSLWASYGLDGPHGTREAYSVNHPATAAWSEETFWAFLHAYHDVVDLANPVANVSDLVDAIDHAVALIGIDHVGISSDFNHGGGVKGWTGADETLNVTAELLRRGYGEADVAKLWGANFMRVWQDVLDLGRSEGRA